MHPLLQPSLLLILSGFVDCTVIILYSTANTNLHWVYIMLVNVINIYLLRRKKKTQDATHQQINQIKMQFGIKQRILNRLNLNWLKDT